jgi:hypothetical protein
MVTTRSVKRTKQTSSTKSHPKAKRVKGGAQPEKQQWVDLRPEVPAFCGENETNANLCLSQIEAKFPNLVVCQRFGAPLPDSASLPVVHHVFNQNISGVILNEEETAIIGVKNTADVVSRVRPAVFLVKGKEDVAIKTRGPFVYIPSAAENLPPRPTGRKPVIKSVSPTTPPARPEGRKPLLNVGNIPVIQPVSQESADHLMEQVKNAPQNISPALRKELKAEMASISQATPDAPPMAPALFSGPYLVHSSGHGTLPLVVDRQAALGKITPKLKKTGKVEVKSLASQDELFSHIANGRFQLKKVDLQTNHEYNPLHQNDFAQLSSRRKSLAKPIKEAKGLISTKDQTTLQSQLKQRRKAVEVSSDEDDDDDDGWQQSFEV